MATKTRLPTPGIKPVRADILQRHPQNPRKGDVGTIEDMILEHGWHGVLVVQASTGHILAGNHRFLAALALWERNAAVPGLDTDTDDTLLFPCHIVEVDDSTALRILLADNRASDLAEYDEPELLRLVAQVGDADSAVAVLISPESTSEDRAEALKVLRSSEYGGTGYSTEDVAQIAMGLLPETVQDKTYRTPEDMLETYEHGSVRQIMLIFEGTDYEVMLVALKQVREEAGVETNTEAVFHVLEKVGLVKKGTDGWINS